ncbi:GIY-YIG nuclease family protein [Streptomyces lavendulocolor]|uniref:GIY-YIG nuclease family protein n=1 Tax=Streptomyces lavendulocolor TaxID=67316 RepID=UPI003C2F5C65
MTESPSGASNGGSDVRWYLWPDDIAVYTSPVRGYEYQPCSDNPSVWEPVRMLTPEELHLQDLADVREKARREAEAGGDCRRTALYRLRDKGGHLIYVGVSNKPQQRWAQHAGDKSWWNEVTDLSQEWFESRTEALAVEAFVIRTETPKYNVLHNRATA